MLTRTIISIILAMALMMGASLAASAKSFHHRHGYRAHHGWFVSRGVSMRRQSGAPVSVSPAGGDRAPITGGGY
jgi:hypothetical protein